MYIYIKIDSSILIVNITLREFHISLQIISKTDNFYELLFTGIDK